MNIRCALLLAGALTAARAVTNDPVTEVQSALQRLRAHRSYAWEATLTPSVLSGEGTRITPALPANAGSARTGTVGPAGLDTAGPSVTFHRAAPVIAVTDKELGTMITAFARFSESEDSLQIVLRNGTAIAETAGGWLTATEIDGALKILPARNRMPPSGVPIWMTYRVARAGLALRVPAEELTWLVAGSNQPMMADRRIVATLTEATAKQFLQDYKVDAPAGVQPSWAEGSVAISLKNGEVAKYEVSVRGTIADRDQIVNKITTMDSFDKARVKIPKAALTRLAR